MKCHECGKVLMAFSEFECSYCGKVFCGEHRLPESHHCEMSAEKKKAKLRARRKEQKPGLIKRLLRKLFS